MRVKEILERLRIIQEKFKTKFSFQKFEIDNFIKKGDIDIIQIYDYLNLLHEFIKDLNLINYYNIIDIEVENYFLYLKQKNDIISFKYNIDLENEKIKVKISLSLDENIQTLDNLIEYLKNIQNNLEKLVIFLDKEIDM